MKACSLLVLVSLVAFSCAALEKPAEAALNSARALFLAAHSGKTDEVKALIAAGQKLDVIDQNGNTPLMAAAQEGRVETVKALLDGKPTLDFQNSKGKTALHFAAKNGREEIVEILVNAGLDKNKFDSAGRTPLIEAVFAGHSAIVSKLLKLGADVNAMPSGADFSALHVAAVMKNKVIVQQLLDAGANPNLVDREGRTPLSQMIKAGSGTRDVVEALIKAKTDLNLPDADGNTVFVASAVTKDLSFLKSLVAGGADPLSLGKNKTTALHVAAKVGSIDVLQYLVSLGLRASALDGFNRTALYYALANNRTAAAAYLEEQGAPVKDLSGKYLDNLLQAAVMSGNVEQIRRFLEPEKINKPVLGEPLLHTAAKANKTDAVAYLLSVNASVLAVDRNGRIPLFSAVIVGNMPMVTILLDAGSTIMHRSNDNLTALHWAAQEKNIDMAKFLLARGAESEAVTADLRTPLHFAAQSGAADIVALLCTFTNVNQLTKSGKTPLLLAVMAEKKEAVEALLQCGADVAAHGAAQMPPLFAAAGLKSLHIMNKLLEAKADVNAVHEKGTPLLYAAHNNNSDFVRLLLLRKADPNLVGTSVTFSPLMICAYQSKAACVALLLNASANANYRDKSNLTALHHACIGGDRQIVKMLLAAGADVNAVSSKGATPLIIAAALGHEAVVVDLLKLKPDTLAVTETGESVLDVVKNNTRLTQIIMKHNEENGCATAA